MYIDAIHSLVENELKQTEQLVLESLHSPIELINEISRHIIQSGGKRIRPLLVLLSAKVFGHKGDLSVRLAAIVELIHTATLLHDDVVDASELRRGKSTANAVWGNEPSVLVGDYLYSHAFRLMVDMDSMSIMDTLARSTNKIVQGEIKQLLNAHNPKTTEADYLEVIRCKTGELFKTSAELGAMVAGCSEEGRKTMAEFGMQLGTAFQITDDALDYHADIHKVGKNIGDDLAEGKPTLPLIYALQKCNADEAKIIEQSLMSGNRTHLSEILQIIESTQAMKYTRNVAQSMITKGLDCLRTLPASIYRDALEGLAMFAVERNY